MTTYLLTLLLIISFTGCDHSSTHQQSLGLVSSVKEVRLSDGTKCVVYVGAYGGGISCNWSPLVITPTNIKNCWSATVGCPRPQMVGGMLACPIPCEEAI